MLIRLLRRFLAPYRGLLAGMVALQLLAILASLLLPTLNAQIIDRGVATGDIDYIWRLGGVMLLVAFTQVLVQVNAVRLGAKSAMGLGRDLRSHIFDHVLSFSSREVTRFGAPSLITRNTNDVQQVQQLVLMSSIMAVGAPIMMIGGVVMALREDIPLSGLILVAVIALAVGAGSILGRMTPLFQQNQERIDTVNTVLREQITGIRVIRAFTREPDEQARFAKANQDLTNITISIGVLFAMLFPLGGMIVNVSTTALMWFGGLRINAGGLQIGQLTAFVTYLALILMSVMMATMMSVMVPRAVVCAKRIMEVLDTESSVVPPTEPVTELLGGGHVRFDHVSFAYPGAEAPVLDDVTFELRPGTTTAIIGGVGSGKTSLVNLIPRLHDVSSGVVSVDGVDVRAIDPDTLWATIGLVPQQPYLFSGTVASNLRYGRPNATEDELWQALNTAQATPFVKASGQGLEMPISQGGNNVSGGQRQRLSIARALVKRPPILVFDDAFSALDVATDARLRAGLSAISGETTVLMIAQRVSSIRHADQIIVLDAGRIVGIGSHQDLLEGCPTYAEIVASQLSAEEAA